MKKEQLKENQGLCPTCDGKGLNIEGTVICPKCNGHGYLEKVKAERVLADAKAQASATLAGGETIPTGTATKAEAKTK